MPIPGEIKYEFNRQYRFIEPGGSEPGAWRLATPDNAISGGGGGTGGTTYDFEADVPIVVAVTPSGGVGPNIVKTGMDIQKLNDRTI
jgi:hypothetical protein